MKTITMDYEDYLDEIRQYKHEGKIALLTELWDDLGFENSKWDNRASDAELVERLRNFHNKHKVDLSDIPF